MFGADLGNIADLAEMDALTSNQGGDVYRIARDVLIQNWNLVPLSTDPEIVKSRVLTGTAAAAFIASKYRNLVQAQDNSLPTPDQVMADPRLAQLVTRYAPKSSIKGSGGGGGGDFSPSGKLIGGVPNWVLYGAIGIGAVAMMAKKKR